jgi:hypothetical protein
MATHVTSMEQVVEALDAAIDVVEGLEYGPDKDVWEGRRICLGAVRRAMADECLAFPPHGIEVRVGLH